MLNTQLLFLKILKKDREPSSKEFDDYEWLPFLTADVEGEWMDDVPEDDVMETRPEDDVMEGGGAAPAERTDATSAPARPKVRPIQMGEFLRK